MNYLLIKISSIDEFNSILEVLVNFMLNDLNFSQKDPIEYFNKGKNCYFTLCIKKHNNIVKFNNGEDYTLNDMFGNYYMCFEEHIIKETDIIIDFKDFSESLVKEYIESVKFNLL